MRHRPHNRLGRLHRQTIYALTFLLIASGLVWLVYVYVAAPPGESVPAPHPLAGATLAVHGVAAYAALLAYALVGHAHLRIGWRVPALRSAGFWLCAAIALLAITGLGFYYVATEGAQPYLRWTHVAVGVLLPCALVLHILRGRRATRQH